MTVFIKETDFSPGEQEAVKKAFQNWQDSNGTPGNNSGVTFKFALTSENLVGGENGGNRDGMMDGRDAVFTSLRLWRDANHDGVSDAGELHALTYPGVARIELRFKESRRRDQHGNGFRYRAKVYGADGAQPGRWARDVFLVIGH